jgi:acyl-CoA synthetase (AMP-forming)/AMP-acid ligase II
VEVPNQNLYQFVLGAARSRGTKTALIDAVSGEQLTYAELSDAVASLSCGFVAAGLKPRDVLAIYAPNSVHYPVVFFAALRAGAVVTTINPSYTERELRHQLADSQARWLVTVTNLLATALAASKDLLVSKWLTLDNTGPPAPAQSLIDYFVPARSIAIELQPDNLCVLPYSSGTTGLSKGVMLSHRNEVANIVQSQAVLEYRANDVIMAVLPFFHCYGMQIMMNAGLASGATVVTMPRFDLESFLQAHGRFGVTMSFVAPPIVLALAKHPQLADYDFSKLRFMMSGAAPLGAELALELGRKLGCPVVQGYGMTELGPVSHLTPIDRNRPGTCGLPVPGVEARIVDPSNASMLGSDQEGELWIRGPAVMRGYWNNPAATAATLDADGWLHTGDIARVDGEGYLTVVDRLKELIKFKGFQVAPAELEALLVTHPAVADAAVIGLADVEAGEVPLAFVVRKPEVTVSAQDLMDFVATQVASYKQLRQVRWIDAIPKSPSGKILRRALRDPLN